MLQAVDFENSNVSEQVIKEITIVFPGYIGRMLK
jgi:hypothetical protein